MDKILEEKKLNTQTPIRRLGLSKYSKLHSVYSPNQFAKISHEISPAKMGNVSRKLGLTNPIRTEERQESPARF